MTTSEATHATGSMMIGKWPSFGINNPSAAPDHDPDSDGQNNTFEFLAGFDPTDPTSWFEVTLLRVPGQPAHRQIIFPVIDDRLYTVKTSPDLEPASFAPLLGAPSVDLDGERTVTDTAAGTARKFYKVEIARP